jgi:hypothetical protein
MYGWLALSGIALALTVAGWRDLPEDVEVLLMCL